MIGELEHLKMKTRLTNEMFPGVILEHLCLLLIDKVRDTDKTYI